MRHQTSQMRYLILSPVEHRDLLDLLSQLTPFPEQQIAYANLLSKIARPVTSGELCQMNPPPRDDTARNAEYLASLSDTAPVVSISLVGSDDKRPL